MRKVIGNHEYAFCDRVRDDEAARSGFLHLANVVFGLDFEPWRTGGWWGADYIPHALMDEGRVVANVSANVIRTRVSGADKAFIQIGTVMTAPEYRGRGLARHLMEEVMARYGGNSDGMYLYANDSVLDFYPKFGFVKAQEHQYSLPVQKSGEPVRKLDMDNPADRARLIETYLESSNPYSALPMLGNTGLLMFYCGQFLKEQVYEIPGMGAVAVAAHDHSRMLVYDVFGGSAPLRAILNALAMEETKTAVLGFTPTDAGNMVVEPRIEEDTTMFVTGELVELLNQNLAMFPLLSHA